MASVDILYEGYVKESEGAELVRNTVCLVRDNNVIMVVDPGLVESPHILLDALKNYGLSADDITHVYVTHYHMDHIRNVGLFQKAKVLDYMYEYEGEKWSDHSGDGHKITNDITVMHTPGHTMDDSALLISTQKGIVAISHVWWFPDRTPVEDEMAEDQVMLVESRKKVEESADFIITPHGGIFKVKD
ncbi:MBL fold metallo-hydrolase [Chloroflexota bacterium]